MDQNQGARRRAKGVASSAAIVGVCIAALGIGAAPASAVDVAFPDAHFADCINDALGQPAGSPITDAQAASLPVLNCNFRDISDITGADALTGTTELMLSVNNISDISPVASLTGLRTLHFSNNAVTDVSSLAGLTQLTNLSMGFNQLSDISAVAGLTELTDLDFQHNPNVDLSAVSGLSKLTWLSVTNIDGADLTPLSGLTELTSLIMMSSGVTDIAPLAPLTKLSVVYLGSNSISDLSPLSSVAAADPSDPSHFIDATGQYIAVPDGVVGVTSHTPIIGLDGQPVPVSVSGDVVADPSGLSWVPTAPGYISAGWAIDYAAGATHSFNGSFVQSVAAARPTTLVDDAVSTPAQTPVTVDVLANDGATGEPALDPDTLRLVDAQGDPQSLVITDEGTFEVSNGQIVFAPAAGFAGEASIAYRVTNADGITGDATLTVTVAAAVDADDAESDAGAAASGNADSGATAAADGADATANGGPATASTSVAGATTVSQQSRLAQTGASNGAMAWIAGTALLLLGAGAVITRVRTRH